MTSRDHLRALVDASPVGALLTVPRDWLCDVLSSAGADAAPAIVEAADLTVAEFGRLFTRTPSTVRLWCEQGKIPGAWKLSGKQWRIPRQSIEQFRQKQGAPPSAAVPPSTGDIGDWRRRKVNG